MKELPDTLQYENLTFRKISSMISYGSGTTGVVVYAALPEGLTLEQLEADERYMSTRFVDEYSKALTRRALILDPDAQKSRVEMMKSLLDCFPAVAGFGKHFREVPNEYDKNSTWPWMEVFTPYGTIKVGWRARVIVLDWTMSGIDITAEGMWPESDDTKDGKSIHCWSYASLAGRIHNLYGMMQFLQGVKDAG